MITKPNPIKGVPTMLVARRIRFVAEPVAAIVRAGAVLFEDAVPTDEPRPELILLSKGDQTREFWETLSYAALWFCGWISVGLCFF